MMPSSPLPTSLRAARPHFAPQGLTSLPRASLRSPGPHFAPRKHCEKVHFGRDVMHWGVEFSQQFHRAVGYHSYGRAISHLRLSYQDVHTPGTESVEQPLIGACIGDEIADLVHGADAGEGGNAELRAIGDGDRAPGSANEGVIGVRLHLVVGGAPVGYGHAVDAEETDVEVISLDHRLRGRTDKLIARVPSSSSDHDDPQRWAQQQL